MKGITVCVDYDDLLAVSLAHNARHFEEVLVVTSPTDKRTQAVVERFGNASCYLTVAFWNDGAPFHKGRAMEQGFDVLGRDGWICVFDADTVMPDRMELPEVRIGKLYSPYRRLLGADEPIPPDREWHRLPPGWEAKNGEFAGYFQLFHASDPVLRSRPWYGQKWKTAQGCDSEFYWKWRPHDRVRLPFEVLHLGPIGVNWEGRVTPRRRHEQAGHD